MKIRKASNKDAKNIANVLYRSFYETFRTEENESSLKAYLGTLNEDAILRLMAEENTSFYVSERNNKLQGFVQLVDESPFDSSKGRFIKVERLYIDTEAIGSGLGTSLMKEAMELGRREGFETIWLLVLRSNFNGVQFYEKFGFKTFDTSPGKFKEDREIDLWMKKSLS
ncbi:MAG: GNAT family N-acetyltransferase [Flavobacteriales bacterium]|nr:GNAT family N-acetyltransferase [Flavobacteriales bacterium]